MKTNEKLMRNVIYVMATLLSPLTIIGCFVGAWVEKKLDTITTKRILK